MTAKQIFKRVCQTFAGILLLSFVIRFNLIEKAEIYHAEGQTFERAKVLRILEDNLTENGSRIGNQKIRLKLLTGELKGTETEAYSSSSWLFGATCKEGMYVIAIVNRSEQTLEVSVYTAERALQTGAMILLFFVCIFLVGGKKGLASIAGLVCSVLCIIFLFLPMIYRGISPILAALAVIAVSTAATFLLIGKCSAKTVTAAVGTIGGTAVAGAYAWLFGSAAHISGYNVSDIEELMYLSEQTGIRVGELLFAGILIASLGAVMDVGMSIASAQHEIHTIRPDLDAKELFSSGMHVGKDMIGTMSNTLILAFAGGSLHTLVYLYACDYPFLQLANMYSLAIEIMQGISATMGVVMTVPLTAAIGAVLLTHK